MCRVQCGLQTLRNPVVKPTCCNTALCIYLVKFRFEGTKEVDAYIYTHVEKLLWLVAQSRVNFLIEPESSAHATVKGVFGSLRAPQLDSAHVKIGRLVAWPSPRYYMRTNLKARQVWLRGNGRIGRFSRGSLWRATRAFASHALGSAGEGTFRHNSPLLTPLTAQPH